VRVVVGVVVGVGGLMARLAAMGWLLAAIKAAAALGRGGGAVPRLVSAAAQRLQPEWAGMATTPLPLPTAAPAAQAAHKAAASPVAAAAAAPLEAATPMPTPAGPTLSTFAAAASPEAPQTSDTAAVTAAAAAPSYPGPPIASLGLGLGTAAAVALPLAVGLSALRQQRRHVFGREDDDDPDGGW
jgi:hypothetical protein